MWLTQQDPCHWYPSLPKCTSSTGLSNQRCLLHSPPNRRVWHKAFLRWVRAPGRSRDTFGIPQNASGPVGNHHKGVHQAPAINLAPPMRFRAWSNGPWGLRYGNLATWHTLPDSCHWYHGRPKCDPSTGLSHPLLKSLTVGYLWLWASPSGKVLKRC